MIKKTRKGNMPITRILLITIIAIMLVSSLIIGAIIFHNWFDFADRASIEVQLRSIITENMVYTLIFVLITIAITIILYFILTRKLFKPIYSLIETTERFANGDLTQRAKVVRNDEIGMISKSFNCMADTMSGLVNDLEHKVNMRTLELEKANEAMLDSRNQLKLILDSTAEAIFGLDMEGNCTFCNISSIAILGYSNEDELIGKNMHNQIHHSRRDGSPIPINECRIDISMKSGEMFFTDDEVFWRKDGSCFEVEYYVYPQFKGGEIVGAVCTFTDITVSKKIHEHIEYLNTHDPITGLYNRMFFENELKRIDNIENLPISIVYGDVNGLKLLNDIYGHEKGDELLKKTSEVLLGVCIDGITVSRIGGDEFIVLLPKTSSNEAKEMIKRIKRSLANEKIAGIKGSISLASDTKTELEQDIESVIKNAETEMYKVKTLDSKNVNSGMLMDIMESLYERSPRENRHGMNVSRMCEKIALNMGLPEVDIKRAKEAGFYHDIGKIVLDKNILNKDEMLMGEELEEMERHPLIGFRLLNLFNETLDIAEVVLTHHEHWDGTGYPKGLKGEEIPLIGRIISVAEGYDAMTNKVNGVGFTHEEAIEEIKSLSGTKYDPKVVEKFIGAS